MSGRLFTGDMPMILNPKYELQAELVRMVCCVFLNFFFLGLTNSTSKSMMNYCSNDALCWRREFFKDSDYFVQLKEPPIGCQSSGMHTILQVRTV